MAGVAIAAWRTQGLAGEAHVCALDAANEACRLILMGELTFHVFTKSDDMATLAAALSLPLARGKNISSIDSYSVPGGASGPVIPDRELHNQLGRYRRTYSRMV